MGLRHVFSEGKRNGSSTFRPNSYNSISQHVWSSTFCVGKLKAKAAKCRCASSARAAQQEDEKEEEKEEEFQVLSALRSSFNDILIIETPNSRMLLLDSTRMLSLSLSRRLLLSQLFICMFLCQYMQKMSIAFFTRTGNGLVPIGYVSFSLSFFLFCFLPGILFLESSLSCAIHLCNMILEST